METEGVEPPDVILPQTSRRQRHPKPRYELRDALRWLLRPFELAPRKGDAAESRVVYRRPAQLPDTSRYRARRRVRRLRLRRRLIAILWGKRLGYTFAIMVSLGLLIFWAKLAVVYNIPNYLQVGTLSQANAYLVMKSWWFGPTSFNLAAYQVTNPLNPLQSLATELSRYQDVVTNPQEILYVFVKRTL